MIVIIGKTASGKDTLLNLLVSKYKFKKCITYTTRPKRFGEKQGKTYHFISDEEFKNKIENGFFAEWKAYNTEFGKWYYGSSVEDLENADDNTVIILTPDGYRDVMGKLKNKPKSIYIYANNTTIRERLVRRGDNQEEAKRRLEHDNADFKGVENEVDKIFYNNLDTNIYWLAEKIVYWIKKEK